jgi:hypothetical protein
MDNLSTEQIAERKRRHQAFWAREKVDRPLLLLTITAPERTQDDDLLESLSKSDPKRYWADPEMVMLRARRNQARTVCLGDSLPTLRPPFGPSMLSGMLGSRMEFAPNTVWFHPTVEDLAELEPLEFDPQNRWWRTILRCCEEVAAEPGAIPGALSLGALGDNLAALIGTEKLMLEMVERPELVKRVLGRMLEILKACQQELFRVLSPAGQGTANWLGVWSPGKTGIVECDPSIMLSTEMYEEFFAREFQAMCGLFDHSLFHLDGTACQRHLDFLLRTPRLDGFQLGSDPGTPAMKILPAIEKIQAAGKCVFTYAFPDEIEELSATVSARGLCLVSSAKTAAEAEALAALARAGAARRKPAV